MNDFATEFGRRQDALKTLYTEVTATTQPPNRPLGSVDMVGNILIEIHHRLALISAVSGSTRTLDEVWSDVREIAEYEWALVGPTVIEAVKAKQAAS